MASAVITISDTEDEMLNIKTQFDPEVVDNKTSSPAQALAFEFYGWIGKRVAALGAEEVSDAESD